MTRIRIRITRTSSPRTRLLRRIPVHPRHVRARRRRRRRRPQRHVVPPGPEPGAGAEAHRDRRRARGADEPRALDARRVPGQADGPLGAVEHVRAVGRPGRLVQVAGGAARPGAGGGRRGRAGGGGGGGAGGARAGSGAGRGGGRPAAAYGGGGGVGRRRQGRRGVGGGRGAAGGRRGGPGADAAEPLQPEVDRPGPGGRLLQDHAALGAVGEEAGEGGRGGAPGAAGQGAGEGPEGVLGARPRAVEEEGDGFEGREVGGEQAVAGAVGAAEYAGAGDEEVARDARLLRLRAARAGERSRGGRAAWDCRPPRG